MTIENVIDRVRRHPWLLALLLFQGAAFLLFANTFDNAWTYDDFPVIVNNPDVRSWAGFWQNSYPGRPLRELSFLLDHALFGLQPAGWHIQQLFWHGLNAFLIYALLRRLHQSQALAVLAGGLFLAHPLTVEVVANLSHRKDSLALAFMLLAVHAWLSALRAAVRWRWITATFVLWGVALLAKENAIMLPALLLLMEWTLLPRDQRWLARSRLAPALFGATAIVVAVAGFFLRGGPAAYARAGQFVLSKLNVLGDFSPADYCLALLKSWAFMLVRVVFPVDLAVEYAYPLPAGLFDPWALPMLLLVVALPALIVLLAGRWPTVAFGLGWAVLLFLPVANLWPGIYFAADRYLYAPLVGAAIVAAWLITRLGVALRSFSYATAVILILTLGVLTWRQSDVWESEQTLWSRAVAVSPDSVYALNNLGVMYGRQKDWQKALELITRAAANPYYREAQENLARLHAWLGNAEEARRYQERARNPHAAER